jgi:hypothetical protein
MPIRSISRKIVEEPGKSPYILMTLSTGTDTYENTTTVNPTGLTFSIRRCLGRAGKDFVRNADGTVAALNICPRAQWEIVYLVLSFREGHLQVLTDVNEQVARLCAAQKLAFNPKILYVERIQETTIETSISEVGKPVYQIRLSVNETGQIRLLSYRPA